VFFLVEACRANPFITTLGNERAVRPAPIPCHGRPVPPCCDRPRDYGPSSAVCGRYETPPAGPAWPGRQKVLPAPIAEDPFDEVFPKVRVIQSPLFLQREQREVTSHRCCEQAAATFGCSAIVIDLDPEQAELGESFLKMKPQRSAPSSSLTLTVQKASIRSVWSMRLLPLSTGDWPDRPPGAWTPGYRQPAANLRQTGRKRKYCPRVSVM